MTTNKKQKYSFDLILVNIPIRTKVVEKLGVDSKEATQLIACIERYINLKKILLSLVGKPHSSKIEQIKTQEVDDIMKNIRFDVNEILKKVK